MIYTKTHYYVEKFTWVFKLYDFSPSWKNGILTDYVCLVIWLVFICTIIASNNDDILLISDSCMMPLWGLGCIFYSNSVYCNTIICYMYIISILLSLVIAIKCIWHIHMCIFFFLQFNVRCYPQMFVSDAAFFCKQTFAHSFNNKFICQNVEVVFGFSSCI